MKTKTLLIVAISIFTFLFTSCEKEEMGVGGTSGGGNDANIASSSYDRQIAVPQSREDTIVNNVKVRSSDLINSVIKQ